MAGGSIFQSTLSLRRATGPCHHVGGIVLISIHALLAESDLPPLPPVVQRQDFNPRSPCGERLPTVSRGIEAFLFQSTLSLRRATIDRFATHDRTNDFNPRSPCGERPRKPLVWGDDDQFQSTLSLRRATRVAEIASQIEMISIHALLAESDNPVAGSRSRY